MSHDPFMNVIYVVTAAIPRMFSLRLMIPVSQTKTKRSEQSSPGCPGWAPPVTRGRSLPRMVGRLSYTLATN